MPEHPSRQRSYGRLKRIYESELAGVPAPGDGSICALPIPGSEANRLGRYPDGRVCLILSTPGAPVHVRPDVRLQNLRVQRRMVCEITRPTGEHESMLGVVITCTSESHDLLGFFLDLFDQALVALGASPAEKEVEAWIEHACRLFEELEDPSISEIRGLWGELLVISEARDSGILARRWHEDPDEQFDFSSAGFALEVKTCRDLERVHVFSLRQLRPTTDLEIVIASVPVHVDPIGVSVLDLLIEAEARIADPRVRDRLREKVFRLGGGALAQSTQRFDRRAAAKGLRFVRASRIPAINERPSPEILDVQLRIRCRDVPAEDLAGIVEARFSM